MCGYVLSRLLSGDKFYKERKCISSGGDKQIGFGAVGKGMYGNVCSGYLIFTEVAAGTCGQENL
jgi:hypothetical protein